MNQAPKVGRSFNNLTIPVIICLIIRLGYDNIKFILHNNKTLILIITIIWQY